MSHLGVTPAQFLPANSLSQLIRGSFSSMCIYQLLRHYVYDRCNLLEEITGEIQDWTGEISIEFGPFKIVNVLLYV